MHGWPLFRGNDNEARIAEDSLDMIDRTYYANKNVISLIIVLGIDLLGIGQFAKVRDQFSKSISEEHGISSLIFVDYGPYSKDLIKNVALVKRMLQISYDLYS